MVLYPLIFKPIFKERVWGGRELASLYQKAIPEGVPIGESWEISDRPGDESIVANGPLAGKSLHWLVQNHPTELLGRAQPEQGRFPLLVKILDAREKLSLQVHPPASRAKELGGDPKTEMWFITNAEPDAELYVGLKRGVTKPEFERKIQNGNVADCFHRLRVRAGDAMFLPSGRVHAIGAGLVIFEIQQNSDTTYRVFDWNRVGLDGKPRELHLPQSLASIDFSDIQPPLIHTEVSGRSDGNTRSLVRNELFDVDLLALTSATPVGFGDSAMRILAVVSGQVLVRSESEVTVMLQPGQFCLLPASLRKVSLHASGACQLLVTRAGEPEPSR